MRKSYVSTAAWPPANDEGPVEGKRFVTVGHKDPLLAAAGNTSDGGQHAWGGKSFIFWGSRDIRRAK
jgi:hypothetical protein